jgi:hypothetical protein
VKTDDKIFLETGVEFRDVIPNVKTLGLEADPEILAMKAESGLKLQAYIQKHKELKEA